MRILIIEDDPGAALVLQEFLLPLSSSITVAHTMDDALKAVAGAEEINLITVDLGLPDSDVQSTLARIRHIRQRRPESLIVVVTGQDIDGLEKIAVEQGADGLVTKQSENFTAKGFLQVLAAIMQRYKSTVKNPTRSIDILEVTSRKLAELQSNENRAT